MEGTLLNLATTEEIIAELGARNLGYLVVVITPRDMDGILSAYNCPSDIPQDMLIGAIERAKLALIIDLEAGSPDFEEPPEPGTEPA